MNRPLRRGHRRAVVALAVVVPGLYVLAIQARRGVPATNAILETVSRVGRFDGPARDVDVRWDGAPVAIGTRVWANGAVLELLPADDPARPDVLVYWRPDAVDRDDAGDLDAPGAGAHLLGTMSGAEPRRFALPAAALSGDGRLLLWSLAHAELVASAALPATGGEE